MKGVTESLTVEQFIPLCRKLARRIAWEHADEDDLVQEACIALHLALQRVPRPDRPWAFARTVASRTMQGYYPRSARTRPRAISLDDPTLQQQEELPLPDLARALTVQAPPSDEQLIDHYLTDLEAACGRQVRWAAESLIEPGDGFGRFVLAEVEDKQGENSRREEGPRLRGVEQIRISHRQIREALGLSTPTWHSMLSEIRSFTRRWLAQRGLAVP